MSSQRETQAQLLAAQQSVVEEQTKAREEQRANREAQESLSLRLLEAQKELEASRLAVAQESAKAARLQQGAIDKKRAWEAEKLALKSAPTRSRLPPASSLPHC